MIVVGEDKMGQDVLGVGISIRCDDSDFRDLGPNLDEAARLGVDYVEIPTLTMPLVADGRVMPEQVRKAKAAIGERPFGITVHGPIAINLMDDLWRLPLHRQVLAASLEVAAELGARHYVMHTGMVGDGQAAGIDDAYARQREALREAGDLAAKLDILVTVENVFTYKRSRVTALPARLAQEIAAVDHPNIKACFDFSHGYINCGLLGADFLEHAAALAPHAKHLHVHDSFGRPHDITTHSKSERLAFGQGDIHLPVGWGSIPWQQLMASVQFHPGVIFNIELEKAYWSQIEATIAATRELAAIARTTAG